ncbi:hypothetical protein HK100_012801 [Physocladia obscura]|uniref:Uncharacterized protein n=1 Tax=Physocladia obscura TaxID=109957 RepID=A0AAD5XC80_9FUNG|nr:hypothetical protein HK100_012801 [Physocladia obscura]
MLFQDFVPYPQPDDSPEYLLARNLAIDAPGLICSVHITHLPPGYAREEINVICQDLIGYQLASAARKTLRQYTNLVATYAKPKPVVIVADMEQEQQQQQQVNTSPFVTKDMSQFDVISGEHITDLETFSSVSPTYHLDDDFINVSEKLAKLSMARASASGNYFHSLAQSSDSFVENREALQHPENGLKTPQQPLQQAQQSPYEIKCESLPDINFESRIHRFNDFDEFQQVPTAGGKCDDFFLQQEIAANFESRISIFSNHNVVPQPPLISNKFVIEQEPFSPSERNSRKLSLVHFDISPTPYFGLNTSRYGNESSNLSTTKTNVANSFDPHDSFRPVVLFMSANSSQQEQILQEQQILQQNYQRCQQQHWEDSGKTFVVMPLKTPSTPATTPIPTPNPANTLDQLITLKNEQQHQQKWQQQNEVKTKLTEVIEITSSLPITRRAVENDFTSHQRKEKQYEVEQDEETPSSIVPETTATTSQADSEYSFKNQPPRNSSKHKSSSEIFPWPLSRQEMGALYVAPTICRNYGQYDDDSSESAGSFSDSSESSSHVEAPINLKTKKRSFVDQLVGMEDLEAVPSRRRKDVRNFGVAKMSKHRKRRVGATSAVMPVIPARNVAMFLGMTYAATLADATPGAASTTEKTSDSFYVHTVGKGTGMTVDAAVGSFVAQECEENLIKRHSIAMLNSRSFENF